MGRKDRTPKRDLPASIHARLLALKTAPGEDFQHLLVRFAVERLLYRISVSPFAGEFILKGAMLFAAWQGTPHRPTMDLDLLGYGEPAVEAVVEVFRRLAQIPADEDGLVFDVDSVRGEEIREQGVYRGVRVHLRTQLGKAVIPVQVDIGFGDPVTPGPVLVDYPSLLDHPTPRLRAYPAETVVAEKLESIVVLGITTSRMKDIYDLWYIARSKSFAFGDLHRAVRSTFDARATALPAWPPMAFTSEFCQDKGKRMMWKAFLSRSRLEGPDALDEAIREVGRFLRPVIVGTSEEGSHWPPGGPWQDRGSE